MFGEIIQNVSALISIWSQVLFRMLQLYEQLGSIKEELISVATGIPVTVVSVISFVILLIKLFK